MQIQNLIGFILPPVIDILNKNIDDAKLRYILSLVICILVGVVVNLNNINKDEFFGNVAIIIASAQMTYKMYWENSGLRKQVKK